MAPQESAWIDLAPNHKLGLLAANPILLGAGAIGYGEAIPRGLNPAQLGAAVVGPILGGSRGGSPPPRLTHVNGGVVLETGLQNRGVNNAVQQYGKLWEKLGCPVVVQVAESHPQTLVKVLGKLAHLPGVQGIELLLPPDLDAPRLAAVVRAAERECELPLWVKLPLARAAVLAPAACEAGAVGLVVGQAPAGAGGSVQGGVYGPLVFPLMLAALREVAALGLPAALIACGGVHTSEQVEQALTAGASAVQIDSAVWVEPGLPGRLASR
jgi:dihydroorotate dehydrogenase (NAD+) catalytic subunit